MKTNSSFPRTFARVISILMAAAVVAIIVLYPRMIANTGAEVPHGFLAILMIGMSFAWVHGFGFIPHNSVLKRIFTPYVAWPILAIGLWGVFIR
ncbi:MAG: cyd operon YbgE family protein [Duodenibacillus sp.]|nr:cyd operon YbgE family protein [Duodenibacillus sp.]